ncbi:MAG: hypothetical protein CMG13_01645 [Candidatus Marinimicrobia bacterium]|nr:hypothetical protein [Candidatus Neomarinimicrobiota bacterium]
MSQKIDSDKVESKFKITESFWTGLFVCVVSVGIWMGYNYLRGPQTNEGFFIKVKFDNIFGLTKGNDVIFKGLLIGEVREVSTIGGASSSKITPIVTLNIQEKYTDLLYNDTRFSIKSPLLVGDYWIEATRPLISTFKNTDRLKEGQIIDGFTELNPSDFAAGIEQNLTPILINLGVFSNMLSELVVEGQIKENIKTSFKSLAETLDEIEKLLKNIEIDEDSKIEFRKIRESVDNLHKGSESFEEISINLNSAIRNLSEVSEKLNSGEGSFSKFVNDDSFYNEYQSIAKNLNGLISDIQNNPKKYIKWSDILKAWRGKD